MSGMTSGMPDVLGWRAEEAEEKLHAHGWKVRWKRSGPAAPEKEAAAVWRVIRQRVLLPQEVEVTVACFSTEYLQEIN